MATPNSFEDSGLTLFSASNQRNTSTPICLSSNESGYQSSLGSLPYTPYSNEGLETIVDTPEECALNSRYHGPDSLAQVLFGEDGDYLKSMTSDYGSSAQCESQTSSSISKDICDDFHKLSECSSREEIIHDASYSSYYKSDTSLEQIIHAEQNEKVHKLSIRNYVQTVVPGQEVGETHIDFLRHLGHYRYCPGIISLVCAYLSPQDLHNACQVSHTWCRLVQGDPMANKRRKDFLKHNQTHTYGKENGRAPKLRNQQASAFGQWRALANIGNVFHSPIKDNSRIALFQEQAKKLLPCEHLQPCPRCQSPSRVTPQERRARCTFTWCAFDYCTQCKDNFHSQVPCRKSALVGSILRPAQRRDIIGNKTARRNLKRL